MTIGIYFCIFFFIYEDVSDQSDGENIHITQLDIEDQNVATTASTSLSSPDDNLGIKRGHPVHNVWSYAFDDPDAHTSSKPNHAVCKHCKESVRHHHKVLSVKTHLKRCKKFKKLMLDTAVVDRPGWWNDPASKSKKSNASKSSTSNSSKSSPGTQPSARSFAVPMFTTSQQKKFNRDIAMFFYNTGTSFQRIEDPFLASAVQLARPGVKLPTRKELADDSPGGLLQQFYEEVKHKVDKLLSNPNQFIGITTDAWSNISNESVINYMAVCPTKSLFIESVYTGEQGHDAQWLSQDLSRVIDHLGDNVAGAVTDNTSANKKMWSILEREYPTHFFHGCVAHGLNLLVKDILCAKKKEPPGGGPAAYPDGYPFEDLMVFANDCKEVVMFFHNHHGVKARLKKALASAKLSSLVKPAPTRWGTIHGCFKSLKAADDILNSLVSERDFVNKGSAKQKDKRLEIKAIVTDPDFVRNLDESIKILQPIDKFIKLFQSDAVPCSDVYHAFLELEKLMQELTIEERKKAYLVKLVRDRFDFMYGDAHGIAYLLDPRYLGDGMSRTLRKEVEDVIYGYPTKNGTTNNTRKEQMAQEYTSFRIEALDERQQQSFRFKLIGQSKSVLQWWIADGTDWPLLQDLAKRVFSLPASSAASERNFSTFSFVHSKLRNRLDEEKVLKLVYIKTNTMQIDHNVSVMSDDDSDMSTDEEYNEEG